VESEKEIKVGQVIHSCRACGKKIREGEEVQLLLLTGFGQDGRIVPQPVFICPVCRTLSMLPQGSIVQNKIIAPGERDLRVVGHG